MSDATYQMQWRCGFCGADGLLALTHRHCPGCGAPQDPTARYFPDDADRVAVEDHPYVGADRSCPVCDAPSPARAAFCGGCGCALDGAAEVARVAPAGEPRTAAAQPAGARGRRGLAVASMVALSALGFGVVKLWTRPVELVVVGHRWERSIAIERLEARDAQSWCERMPNDAYAVTRSREVQSYDRVPDGEVCNERKVDQGDGTWRTTQHCETSYREEPVYADRCHFTIDRWRAVRHERAAGDSLDAEPHWPDVQLDRVGECLGCEREGARSESYRLRLAAPGLEADCELERGAWRSAHPGDRWTAEAGVVLSNVRCESLTPASG